MARVHGVYSDRVETSWRLCTASGCMNPTSKHVSQNLMIVFGTALYYNTPTLWAVGPRYGHYVVHPALECRQQKLYASVLCLSS